MESLSRLTKFLLTSAAIFVVGTFVSISAPQSVFGLLQIVGFTGLLICFLVYSFRALRWLAGKMLWKVRNKLIITFSFVGLLPVLILGLLAWFSITLIFRQLSVVYVETEFEEITDLLHQTTERTVLRFYQSDNTNQSRLEELIQQERENLLAGNPRLATSIVTLQQRVSRRDGAVYRPLVVIPRDAEGAQPSSAPYWTRDGFHGLVKRGNRLAFMSFMPVRVTSADYLVQFELPFDDNLIQMVQEKTSLSIRLIDLDTQLESSVFTDFFSSEKSFTIRWAHILQPISWENPVNQETTQVGILIESPLQAIFQHFFTETEGLAPAIVFFIGTLAVIFVVVEFVSLLIGLTIARSITRSIANLYAGTLNIQQGNFDFRVPAGDRDQLDSMAGAFNRMSESVVRLMNQVSEKERLEKEIEIAREVQTHLFPRELPHIKHLQLAGTCLPARRVSGDYYDFIAYSSDLLDVVVADISGKGISAALLMANLQSSIRSHAVYYGGEGSIATQPIARAVGAINRQLYNYTSPDKFATMVLSRVDANRMTLTYCNAGHNPPLWISDGRVERLTTGGIVVGLFEDPEYEETTVQLKPGDLIVYYTDGVVEAENPRGEQFEEDRLEELVSENAFLTADDIRALIIDDISRWVDGREQRDDVTVVTMKVEA